MDAKKFEYPSPPVGWGKDVMSEFQAMAIHNEYASFVHTSGWQNAFEKVAGDLKMCSLYSIETMLKAPEPASRLLFMQAHNQFMAAVRMAASGQCVAAYPLARAIVESALYGWYLSTDVEVSRRWHEKPAKRKKNDEWGKEFRFGEMAGKLDKVKTGRGQWAKSLHQMAIDFGAHPNADGLYSNMSKQRVGENQMLVQMRYLHTVDRPALLANKFVIEAGLFALELFGRAL